LALDWKGDPNAALSMALHARALDENFAPTYAYLGGIYYSLGEIETAVQYLDQAIEMDTQGIAITDAYYNKAVIYTSQGDYESAVKAYEIAMQKAPNETYIVADLATTYVALDEIETAIAILTQALERNTNDPLLLWSLGWIHHRNGMPEKAEEYYRRCLESSPDNLLCLSYLGGLQYNNGDYELAVVTLQRAIELGSTDPDDFWELGQVLITLGRCGEATGYLQRGSEIAISLSDDPENDPKVARFVGAIQQCNPLGAPAVPTATPAVTPQP
jgi:tetratricopeptide (TPR) repeat protein